MTLMWVTLLCVKINITYILGTWKDVMFLERSRSEIFWSLHQCVLILQFSLQMGQIKLKDGSVGKTFATQAYGPGFA